MRQDNSTTSLVKSVLSDEENLSSTALLRKFLSEYANNGNRSSNKKPMISFTFDDANKTDLRDAMPILKKHGMRGVSFVDWWRIADQPTVRMSENDIKTLYNEGWEIACHTFEHPVLTEIYRLPHGPVNGSFVNREYVTGSTSGAVGRIFTIREGYLGIYSPTKVFLEGETITGSSGATTTLTSNQLMLDEDVLNQWVENRNALENLLGDRIHTCAYPGGRHDARVVNLCGGVYTAACTTMTDVRFRYGSQGSYGQPLYELPRFFIDNRSIDLIKERIKEAVEEGDIWLILGAHGLSNASDRKNPQEFEEIVEYVKQYKMQGKLDVVTIHEGVQRIF